MKFFKKFIGTKAFYKELFVVALPIAFQQLISSLVNFIDTLMIGNYGGTTATGALSIAGRYFQSCNNIMVYLCIACSVFIAQYFGAKQFDKLKKVFGYCLLSASVFGLIAFLCGTIFNSQIISFFSSTINDSGKEMLEYGKEYLFIIAFTFIPLAFTNTLSFILRSMKITKIPLLSSGIAMILNCILNYLFIFTFDMGVKGAAIATLISRMVEVLIIGAYYFKAKPVFYGSIKEVFTLPIELVKKIIRRGYPLVLAQVLTEGMAIFTLFAYASIEKGNAINISSINISQQIVDLVLVLVGGMGTAASCLVGARLGAGKIEEARTNARWQMGYVFCFSIIAGAVMIGVLRPLAPYLFDFDPSEQQLLSMIMLIHALSLPFMFYALNVIFLSRSGGYSKAPLLITNIPYLFVKLPIIVFFVFIKPDLFEQFTWLHQFMESVGLFPTFMIFIFMIDKLVEIIRAIIAYFVYTRAHWYENLTVVNTQKKQEVI